MNQKENLSLLLQLIRLSRVDNEIKEEEYVFLKKIAELMTIDETSFKNLFNESLELEAPAPETERILQFQRLILVANIDMTVSGEELDFLRKAGIKLGLNPEAIEEVFVEMKKNKWGMIEPEKFIHIFQLHHN